MAGVHMRTFAGFRPSPPAEYEGKGITNAGNSADYEGVIYSDGTVAIRWLTQYRSHSSWASWDDFFRVHGHPEYGTRIVFTDGLPPPGALSPRPEARGSPRPHEQPALW